MQELREGVKQLAGSVDATLPMQGEPCKGSSLLLRNALKSRGGDAESR
jgi:hypothetical protein